jgi:hypothetical protein
MVVSILGSALDLQDSLSDFYELKSAFDKWAIYIGAHGFIVKKCVLY